MARFWTISRDPIGENIIMEKNRKMDNYELVQRPAYSTTGSFFQVGQLLLDRLAEQLAEKVIEKVHPLILAAIDKLEAKFDEKMVVKREMNIDQLAEFLNVKRKWIYRQTTLKKNPMPYTKNGKYLTFKVKDVLEWRDRMNGKC
jgi:hypothetical protein